MGKPAGSTGGEGFDLDRANLQRSLQDMTGVVSRVLGGEMYRAEGQRAATFGAEQVVADDLAMRGWAVWYGGLSRENTLQALALFEDAVMRDPDSLRGWAGVSVASGAAVSSGWAADPAAANARGREALRQLVRLDPNDQFTSMARTGLYYRTEDFAGLLQLAGTLVERFPSNPMGHHNQAWALVLLGRFDECADPSQVDPARPA